MRSYAPTKVSSWTCAQEAVAVSWPHWFALAASRQVYTSMYAWHCMVLENTARSGAVDSIMSLCVTHLPPAHPRARSRQSCRAMLRNATLHNGRR